MLTSGMEIALAVGLSHDGLLSLISFSITETSNMSCD